MNTRAATPAALAEGIKRYDLECDSSYARHGAGLPDEAYALHYGHWEKGTR